MSIKLIGDESEQEMLLNDIKNLIMRNSFGEEISFLESLAITMILDGTY